MKNGNLNEFINGLHYGDEMLFVYAKTKYFIQGWKQNGKCYMFLDAPDEKQEDYVWKYEAYTMRECAEAFLSEKIWDGKTFYEIEKDVMWGDW